MTEKEALEWLEEQEYDFYTALIFHLIRYLEPQREPKKVAEAVLEMYNKVKEQKGFDDEDEDNNTLYDAFEGKNR